MGSTQAQPHKNTMRDALDPRAARLRDVRVPLQAQARDEALRDGLPVHARVRGQVRVVVAHRARHLAVQRHPGCLRAAAAQDRVRVRPNP